MTTVRLDDGTAVDDLVRVGYRWVGRHPGCDGPHGPEAPLFVDPSRMTWYCFRCRASGKITMFDNKGKDTSSGLGEAPHALLRRS